jgi:hypothetical protein
MTTSINEGLGFGWAATVGSLAAPVGTMLWQAASSPFDVGELSLSLGPIFLIGVPISLSATWLFGLPFILYMRRRKSLNIAVVCLGGIFIGAIVFVVLVWLVSLPPHSMAHVFGQLVVGGSLGLIVALAFCLLARVPFRSVDAA